MMRSMYSGVSGLRVHQTKMDVIGNNIANVNTTGYKSQRVTFSDVFHKHFKVVQLQVMRQDVEDVTLCK